MSILTVSYNEVIAEYSLYSGNHNYVKPSNEELPTAKTKSGMPFRLYTNSSLHPRQSLWTGATGQRAYKHEGLATDVLSMFKIKTKPVMFAILAS